MNVLQITDVKFDGQAHQLGFIKGDYMLTYGGEAIDSDQKLSQAINNRTKDKVTIVIIRNNKELEFIAKSGPLGISTVVAEIDGSLIEAANKILLTTANVVEGYKVV